jgi:hypothetical protein
MYIFSTQFLDDLAARLTGAMSFRFILQPAVAVILGIKDGIKDAKAGAEPFVINLLIHSKNRWKDLKTAFRRLLVPIIVGIVFDAIAQYLIFKRIHPLPAVIVGTLVIGVPYSAARGLTNRIITARRGKSGPTGDIPGEKRRE